MSRHRHRVLLYISCCALLLTGAARAASIPTAVKVATPLPPGASAIIATVIGDNVKKLTNVADPVALKQARTALVSDSDTGPGAGASADYQAAYITALIPAIQPLLSDPDRQVRLNAAIVVGGVAQAVERNDVADLLLPLIKVMLQSKEPAIQYWGMKTAKSALLSTVAKQGNDGGMGKLIVDTVKASPDGSLFIEEAYLGLSFDSLKGAPPNSPRSQAAFAPITLPFILDLLEWRVGQLKAGAAPGNPMAGATASGYLSVTAWAAVSANPKTQKRTLKVVGELTCLTLQEMKKANGNADGDLADAAKLTGSAVGALGSKLNDIPLEKAGTTINKTVAPNTPADRLDAMCDGVKNALTALGI